MHFLRCVSKKDMTTTNGRIAVHRNRQHMCFTSYSFCLQKRRVTWKPRYVRKTSKKALSKVFVSDQQTCNDIDNFFHSLRSTSMGKLLVKSHTIFVVIVIANLHACS